MGLRVVVLALHHKVLLPVVILQMHVADLNYRFELKLVEQT